MIALDKQFTFKISTFRFYKSIFNSHSYRLKDSESSTIYLLFEPNKREYSQEGSSSYLDDFARLDFLDEKIRLLEHPRTCAIFEGLSDDGAEVYSTGYLFPFIMIQDELSFERVIPLLELEVQTQSEIRYISRLLMTLKAQTSLYFRPKRTANLIEKINIPLLGAEIIAGLTCPYSAIEIKKRFLSLKVNDFISMEEFMNYDL